MMSRETSRPVPSELVPLPRVAPHRGWAPWVLLIGAVLTWVAPAHAADRAEAQALVEQYYAYQGTVADSQRLATGTAAAAALLDDGFAPEVVSAAIVDAFATIPGAKSASFEAIVPPLVRSAAPPPASMPAPAASNPTTAPPVAAASPRVDIDRGGAIVGGIFGLASIAPVMGFAAGSAATSGYGYLPSLPLGIAALAWGSAAGPITAGLAATVREHPQVNGALGARISGWITWGSSLGLAVPAVALGAAGLAVPAYVTMAIALLGATSLAMHAVDALVGVSQAEKLALGGRGSDTRLATRPRLQLAPLLAVAPAVDGSTTVHAGLAGRW